MELIVPLFAAAAVWFLGSVILVPIVTGQKRLPTILWVLVSLICSRLLTLIALAAVPDLPDKRAREPKPPSP